jgi:HEPN domain-containing protein
MNSKALAKEYLEGCKKRLKALELLYKERSYADIDFLPSEEYKESDAKRAKEAAKFSIELLEKILSRKKSEKKNE